MAENIKTRKHYRMYNGTDWDRMHFITDANSVDANDGDNMETKVGAIKGITTSTEVTEEGYAADATTVAALNSSLVADIYVGDDGKLHKVQGGADSVLPFSSGINDIEVIEACSKNFNNLNWTISNGLKYKKILVFMALATTNIWDMDKWGVNPTISVNGANVEMYADKMKAGSIQGMVAMCLTPTVDDLSILVSQNTKYPFYNYNSWTVLGLY